MSASAALTLAAALIALLYSCNFMMPSPNYPVMRQEKELIFLETYRIQTYTDIRDLRFGFGALDGSTSESGAGSPTAFVSLTSRDWGEGKVIFLSPGIYQHLDRSGAGFDEQRISYDAGTGFISSTEDGISRIENAAPNLSSIPIYARVDIELGAGGARFNTLAGRFIPVITFRGIFSDAGDLSARETVTLPGTTLVGPSPYLNGVATVAASFERLTDAAYPGSTFWNPGGFEYRRMGFSAIAGYTWFEATRFDTISGEEEVRLVSLADDGSSIKTSGLAPAGGAGDYILAWKKREAPGFEFAVLNGNLDEVHSFSVYGQDVAFLGEALVAQPSGMVKSAIFATLGTNKNYKDSDGSVIITLYAYPVSLLDGSAP
jgi:hypothetical protein